MIRGCGGVMSILYAFAAELTTFCGLLSRDGASAATRGRNTHRAPREVPHELHVLNNCGVISTAVEDRVVKRIGVRVCCAAGQPTLAFNHRTGCRCK